MLARSLTMIVVLFFIVAMVTWLALTLVVVIHNVFGSLTSFIFLLLSPPVLLALLTLLRPRRRLLSGITV
jgi:hypothetical protein